MKHQFFCLLFLLLFSSVVAQNGTATLKIIIDTDANNVLDDQHALAYAFLNTRVFEVLGVTVNNTRNGGGLQGQYDEAERILTLFDLNDKIPLLKGADKSFAEILPTINQADFDGQPAVDFIIAEALKMKDEKLVLVELGKLTNIALAFRKEPKIIDKVRVIWLGGNYPAPGEYNLENDTTAVNPVFASRVEFDMVTVRYKQLSGTAAVKVTRSEMAQNMKGKGPLSKETVTGRHGGRFNRFGDYSNDLFQHAQMFGNPPSRALFDMVVLAVLKNPMWGEHNEIPAPRLLGNTWLDQPENQQKITLWENFDRDAIVNDLFYLMEKSTAKD